MKGKVVFITGASGGIGEGCACKFASRGSDLILNTHNVTKLEELKEEPETKHEARVCLLPLDIHDRKTASIALASLPGEWENIDVLVDNIGLVIEIDKEFEGNLDEWDIMIDTDTKVLLAITRMVVPGMMGHSRGHIINIGSIAGGATCPDGSMYCATRAAVKVLSDGLRIDLIDTPLRATDIKPGTVEANFTVVHYHGDKGATDTFYKGIRPLTGDDIVETVYYAASALEHMQITEVLVMLTYQATDTISYKERDC